MARYDPVVSSILGRRSLWISPRELETFQDDHYFLQLRLNHESIERAEVERLMRPVAQELVLISKVSEKTSRGLHKEVSWSSELLLPDVERAIRDLKHSRFRKDPNITANQARQIQRQMVLLSAASNEVVSLESQGRRSFLIMGISEGLAEIHYLFVDSQMRGRGVGTELVAQAKGRAFDMDSRICVRTHVSNLIARNLYESAGFTVARQEIAFHQHVNPK